MTNQEAIKIMREKIFPCVFGEWKECVDMAISALQVQELSKTQKELDTISRQAAIDIERNATVDTNPSHFEAHQKFTQFMDDAEISSFGRWQWSNGFYTALTAVGIDLKKLPSAQPDPCEDAVSRADVFKALCWKDFENADCVDIEYCRKGNRYCEDGAKIDTLPPVTPKRKTGKWLSYSDGVFEYVKCDQCHHTQEDKSNFCPNCGADMRGEQDES